MPESERRGHRPNEIEVMLLWGMTDGKRRMPFGDDDERDVLVDCMKVRGVSLS